MVVIDSIDGGLILLTYKGKILLTIENDSPIRTKDDVWSFLSGGKKSNETYDQAMCRCVKSKINILLKNVELLSHWVYKNKKKYFFHAQLSDEEVNMIKRPDGQTIDFFSVRELEALPLSQLTKLFIAKHRDVLQATSSPLSLSQ